MNVPYVKSGSLRVGDDFVCGRGVVIDVDEEVVLGDRCVLGDNTYLSGRRVEIGDDFYGYSWEWKRLDVGRGRRGYEQATLKIGDRCTLHDNFIDLSREVFIGDDVGLSPQVAIYTHSYWQSVLDGYPARYKEVDIRDNCIIGFRSVLVAGCYVGEGCVVGAQSVVCGELEPKSIYGGNPAKLIRKVVPLPTEEKRRIVTELVGGYCIQKKDNTYLSLNVDYPFIKYRGFQLNVETFESEGEEDEFTDDLRDYLFRVGIRIYTHRPFKRLQ